MVERNLTRRGFLHLTAAGAVGWSLLGAEKAEAFAFGSLLSSLGRFAAAVGSAVIADQLSQYLSSLQQSDFHNRLAATNEVLRKKGFTETRWARVRGDSAHAGRIYYPLVYGSCTCQHFAAPFFKVDCGCQHITHIEGGHMAGLALAAEKLYERRQQADVRKILFPRDGVSQPEGDRLNGYSGPLVYKSDAATVYTDFKPKSETTGTVIVEAESDTNGQLLIGKSWDVRFA